MTGDTDPLPAPAQQRQPRRNKVTAEIYKPPAARVQQRPVQPDAPAARSNNNNHNKKQPSPHHNLNVAPASHRPQHAKSPRSNRRKHPQNGRLSLSERSSCSPESSLAQETKSGVRREISPCENLPEEPPSEGNVVAKPLSSSLANGSGDCAVRQETDAPKNVEKSEPALKNNVTLNNDQNSQSNSHIPNDDLRNYLNRKKQAEEIKNLCNAVESASNKYFNKTACPYRKDTTENYRAAHDHNYRNNNQNQSSSRHNGNFPNGCVDNMIRNDGHCYNKMMNESRRARPDQMFYVPRGRRQYGGGVDAYRYNHNYNSPLTDHNSRPPSPAFSITSIVSEFSGRQRYDGENYSRPSSRLSIYDTDDERCDGRPPHIDRRYNSSRESTPGTNKPMGNSNRFSHTSLRLIERSLNPNSVRPDSRNGDVPVNGTSSNESKPNNSDSLGNKQSPEERGDRVCKSPTPNRDSVHYKENMINPVNPSPKKRRSRKNRKRTSHSRDHSYDSMSRDRGSWDTVSLQSGYSNRGRSNGRGYHRPQENSYTVYNSSMRPDGPASLATSRVNSRNPSLERNARDDWRQQKPGSSRNAPVWSQHTQMNGHLSNDTNSFDGPSSLQYGVNLCRRNSTDKPPTGKPRPNDSKRNSLSNRMPGSCSNSARATPTENLSPTIEKSATRTFDYTASYNEDKGSVDASPYRGFESDVNSEAPARLAEINIEGSSFDQPTNTECPHEIREDTETVNVSEPLSPLTDDEYDEDEEPLDWAAEMDREDQRQAKLREQRRREAILQAEEVKKHSSEFISDQHVLESTSRPSNLGVDERTRDDIGTAIGRDAEITPPRHDYSAYEMNSARQLYIPPNERKSPYKTTGNSPPRPRLQRQYSPPHGGDDQSTGSHSPDSSLSPTSEENNQSQLAHVLELYDFPSSFRTADLVAVYQGCQAATLLDIKWVNDTSALAIFSSVALAERALQLQHAQIKSVRLSEASAAAKSKAVTIEEELLPARPRPQTSMMLARRLLSGALGVRVNLSREEREREAKAIKDAKDHKRQVAKQKADVWEGNV